MATDFRIIETMLMEGRIYLLPLHMERMERSARHFGFPFEKSKIGESLDRTLSGLASGRHRVRMLLDNTGTVEITCTPLPEMMEAPTIALSKIRTRSGDVFLLHKTTRRELYDAERSRANAAGFYDILFLNEKGEVTEGAITNVYCRQNGFLYTPPVRCGLLPGTMRRFLMDEGKVREKILHTGDLENAEALFLSNAIIGLREVRREGKIEVI